MSGYIIKVTMEGTHPPMWRRLVIPDKIQFADLHDILQIAFGWEEDHPHGFSFADSVWMRDCQEDSLCIDHLLISCKWIRYTYDFGDNWCHKIEFEKLQEDYQERYAQVIKYRFNNYLEDSGGIWGREDDEWVREEYNIEAVNQRLQKYKYPQRTTGKEAEKFEIKILKKQSQKSMMKDFYVNIRKEAENFLEKEKHNTENAQIAELDKQIEKWKTFLNLQDSIACEKANEMGSMHRQLMQLGEVQLRDYVTYQNLTAETNASKEVLVAKLVTFWEENPQYMLYVLDKGEYQTIESMWSAKRKRVIKEEQFSSLIKGMVLGLFELIQVQVSGLNIVQIRFTAEADAMMQKLEQTKIDEVYRTLKTFETNVLFYMNTYQILEVDTLYQMYTKTWEPTLTTDEFRRRLYWHLRMVEYVNTGRYGSSRKAFVFNDCVDFTKVISIRQKAADSIAYLPFQKEELLKWKRGLGEVIYEWKFVFEMLAYRFRIGEKAAEVSIEEDYFKMQNGMSLTEMCKAYEEVLPLKTLADYTELWYQMMSVSMETGLGFLKGYSRFQYMKLPETNIRNTNLFSYHLLAGRVEPKTHLYELPWETQLALYGMLCGTMPDERNRTKVMEFIDNLEVQYMVVDHLIHQCQFSEADTRLKSLKRVCKDSSVLELEKSLSEIQMLDDDEDWNFPFNQEAFYDEVPKQEPYRRESVKIGRNDPCPCGSGKKYKKCCGR